jgi:polar amino acid transport system permease protein
MNSGQGFLTLLSGEYGVLFLKGLGMTLLISVASWVLAFVLGALLAVLRLTKVKIIEWLIIVFVEYQRNIPPLVHIFLWYFGVSTLLPDTLQDWANDNHGEIYFSVIAIGLYYAAYVSEDIRSGLRSIPHGQYEASRAVGLSYLRSMRYIILPQAFRTAIPPLVGASILLVKTTSLAMIVGAMELTYVTKDIASRTFMTTDVYAFSTAIYVVIALSMMLMGAWITGRTRIKGR